MNIPSITQPQKTSSQVKFFSLSLTFAVIYGLWDWGGFQW